MLHGQSRNLKTGSPGREVDIPPCNGLNRDARCIVFSDFTQGWMQCLPSASVVASLALLIWHYSEAREAAPLHRTEWNGPRPELCLEERQHAPWMSSPPLATSACKSAPCTKMGPKRRQHVCFRDGLMIKMPVFDIWWEGHAWQSSLQATKGNVNRKDSRAYFWTLQYLSCIDARAIRELSP